MASFMSLKGTTQQTFSIGDSIRLTLDATSLSANRTVTWPNYNLVWPTSSGSSGQSLTTDGAGNLSWSPAGAVTSIALTMPGIFTVTGSPVTGSGTLTATAAGNSGGIPYFSSATALASSPALTANQLIIGGGAGITPSALGSLGTTTTVLHGNAAGAPTYGAVNLATDITGNLAISHFNSGTGASSTTFWRGDGTWAAPAGSGSVSSVGLADGSSTPIYTITGSPVTGSGSLTFSLATQNANKVFAGPASGAAAQPTFRTLVDADLPPDVYTLLWMNI